MNRWVRARGVTAVIGFPFRSGGHHDAPARTVRATVYPQGRASVLRRVRVALVIGAARRDNLDMFDIDVVSDPSMALFPKAPIWSPDLSILRTYDENLVKPAILFAETIKLHSTREDLLSLNSGMAFTVGRMPLRRIWSAVGISHRRDPEEIERLGISQDDLIPVDAVREFFDHRLDEDGYLGRFEEEYSDNIWAATDATMKLLRARHDMLIGGVLGDAVRRGVIQSTGWTEEGSDPWSLAWGDESDFWEDGAIRLAEMLASTGGAIMLEPGTKRALGMKEIASSEIPPEMLPGALAHRMLSKLPALQEIPLDELLDLRDDLSEYAIPFRAAMAEMADEISASDASERSLEVEIERKWTKEVAPAIQEMRQKVRSESYPRALLDALSGDRASLIAAASSVGLAAGSVSAGVAALIPAAAAASFPFLKALNSRLKSRDELKRNRLYLLYVVQR